MLLYLYYLYQFFFDETYGGSPKKYNKGHSTPNGKAGNPDIMSGVDIIIGPGTEVIAGEGKIITAGGLDVHIHFICPQQIDEDACTGPDETTLKDMANLSWFKTNYNSETERECQCEKLIGNS